MANLAGKAHTQSTSVWVVTNKKNSGAPHVAYSDLVEEALCFGWIDSLPRALDEARTMLLMSPRKAASAWSALNKKRAVEMIAHGLMRPPGLAVIEAAKASGKWTSLDQVEALTLPPDLAKSFTAYPKARSNFEAFPRSVKRGILEWIGTAKKPETRTKRINETARLAAEGKRANQWR
jgi:uncharacterized protein YdeI (YjbR/CyaY-like superfamily)